MYRILVALIGVLICCKSFASKEQTDAYIAALSHPYKEVSRLAAADIYKIPLVSDSRLFEFFASEIRSMLDADKTHSLDLGKVAQLAKALSASGLPQYEPLLQEVEGVLILADEPDSGNRDSIRNSISKTDYFHRWQAIISPVNFDGINQDEKIGLLFLEKLASAETEEVYKINILQVLYSYGYVEYPPLYEYLRSEVKSQVDLVSNRHRPESLLEWKAKALMSEGMLEDRPLISKLKMLGVNTRWFNYRHFENATATLKRFRAANDGIIKVKRAHPSYTGFIRRYLGLLESTSVDARVFGLRQLFNKHRFDAPVYHKVFTDLNEAWQKKNKDKMENQYQAWACKYLMASGKADAVSLISEIAKSGPNKYVRKHAKAQLKIYAKLGLVN